MSKYARQNLMDLQHAYEAEGTRFGRAMAAWCGEELEGEPSLLSEIRRHFSDIYCKFVRRYETGVPSVSL